MASKRHRSALERTLSTGKALLKAWNELGESLTQQSKNVLEFIEGYGLEEVEAASSLALENETPLSCSIELILMHKNPPRGPKLKLPKEVAAIEIDHRSMAEFDELY